MSEETSAPTTGVPPSRKRARRWGLALGAVVLALAGWWFGVELPLRRAGLASVGFPTDERLQRNAQPDGHLPLGKPKRLALGMDVLAVGCGVGGQGRPTDACNPAPERPFCPDASFTTSQQHAVVFRLGGRLSGWRRDKPAWIGIGPHTCIIP
jgi:hypothetical protein